MKSRMLLQHLSLWVLLVATTEAAMGERTKLIITTRSAIAKRPSVVDPSQQERLLIHHQSYRKRPSPRNLQNSNENPISTPTESPQGGFSSFLPPVASQSTTIDRDDNSTTSGGSDESKPSPNGQSYDFLAYLIWYCFLFFCCVVPTCCGGLIRQRRQQQREPIPVVINADFGDWTRHNLYLWHLQHHRRGNDEDPVLLQQQQQHRIDVITKQLQETTWTVTADSIVANLTSMVIDHDDVEMGIQMTTTTMTASEKGDEGVSTNPTVVVPASAVEEGVVEQEPQSAENDIEEGGEPVTAGVGLSDDYHSQQCVELPISLSNGGRQIPGGCAICLDVYRVGDSITWSPLHHHGVVYDGANSCRHAFHTDCIVPWLAKQQRVQPQCPCCRQAFVTATTTITTTPPSDTTETNNQGEPDNSNGAESPTTTPGRYFPWLHRSGMLPQQQPAPDSTSTTSAHTSIAVAEEAESPPPPMTYSA